ncbi:hypothetical protein RIR_jg27160.t1 [Rhizophagus irregularis DAOM 181602=DAOM 197198]|nr:hypothetical protein RIR_jg27160.t1 [Rhizophagus irregularis DAOM 181602=DAOM 197198]
MMIGHWTHEQLLRYQICINFIKIIEISNFFLFEGNQNAVTLRTSAPMVNQVRHHDIIRLTLKTCGKFDVR